MSSGCCSYTSMGWTWDGHGMDMGWTCKAGLLVGRWGLDGSKGTVDGSNVKVVRGGQGTTAVRHAMVHEALDTRPVGGCAALPQSLLLPRMHTSGTPVPHTHTSVHGPSPAHRPKARPPPRRPPRSWTAFATACTPYATAGWCCRCPSCGRRRRSRWRCWAAGGRRQGQAGSSSSSSSRGCGVRRGRGRRTTAAAGVSCASRRYLVSGDLTRNATNTIASSGTVASSEVQEPGEKWLGR